MDDLLESKGNRLLYETTLYLVKELNKIKVMYRSNREVSVGRQEPRKARERAGIARESRAIR